MFPIFVSFWWRLPRAQFGWKWKLVLTDGDRYVIAKIMAFEVYIVDWISSLELKDKQVSDGLLIGSK